MELQCDVSLRELSTEHGSIQNSKVSGSTELAKSDTEKC